MAYALDALGQPRSVMDEWLKYVGLPGEAGIRNTFDPLGLDGDAVLKAYRGFGHVENEHMLRPFEGIPELLDELRARGQRMGVAPSKRTVPLMRQMARFGWESFFDPIVTPDDVTHGKPHPETLELMQTRTGLGPEDILMRSEERRVVEE